MLERADERLDPAGRVEGDGGVDGVEEVVVQDATQGEGARAVVANVGEDVAEDRGRKADEAVLRGGGEGESAYLWS